MNLDVLDHAMGQVQRIPPDRFGLDDAGYRALRATVHRWQTHVRQLREQLGTDRDVSNQQGDLGIDLS